LYIYSIYSALQTVLPFRASNFLFSR
jgi:hypothetical protein